MRIIFHLGEEMNSLDEQIRDAAEKYAEKYVMQPWRQISIREGFEASARMFYERGLEDAAKVADQRATRDERETRSDNKLLGDCYAHPSPARATGPEGWRMINYIEITKDISRLERANDRLNTDIESDVKALEQNIARLREIQSTLLKELWRIEPPSRLIKAVPQEAQ